MALFLREPRVRSKQKGGPGGPPLNLLCTDNPANIDPNPRNAQEIIPNRSAPINVKAPNVTTVTTGRFKALDILGSPLFAVQSSCAD